jgi:hypothetical protein
LEEAVGERVKVEFQPQPDWEGAREVVGVVIAEVATAFHCPRESLEKF